MRLFVRYALAAIAALSLAALAADGILAAREMEPRFEPVPGVRYWNA